MPVIIGTSGWQYKSWRKAFYRGAPQRLWLEDYTQHFQTVEVNNAFYRLPERSTFEAWRQRTPDDFIVGVKMSRYLTHIKRLRGPEEPVSRFLDRVSGLDSKLGPVLLQLPPNLGCDIDALRQTLTQFPSHIRLTVEFRHDSWYTDEVRALLEKNGVALCLADSPARSMPYWRTAEWGYVRFHEGVANPHPCYSKAALKKWAQRIAELWQDDEDVYVYFNNDPNVCAVRDAGLFAAAAATVERTPTRTPPPQSIRVGPEETEDPLPGI